MSTAVSALKLPDNFQEMSKQLNDSLARSRRQQKQARIRANLERDFSGWDERYYEQKLHLAPFIRNYGWPTEEDVPRLIAAGGNPYLEFWQQYYGWLPSETEHWEPMYYVAPGFQDARKLRHTVAEVFGRDSSGEHWMRSNTAAMQARDYAVNFFGWAVPTAEAIAAIAALKQPIADLGAGRGYWAWLLRRAGVEVAAFEPSSYTFRWAETTRRKPDGWRHRYALLFVWPSYEDPWSGKLLAKYKGDTVIHVGEGNGGCTGNKRFHALLERHYEEAETVEIPQWWGIHDYLSIWRRKGAR